MGRAFSTSGIILRVFYKITVDIPICECYYMAVNRGAVFISKFRQGRQPSERKGTTAEALLPA